MNVRRLRLEDGKLREASALTTMPWEREFLLEVWQRWLERIEKT